MSDAFVQVPVDSTGKKIDQESLSVGAHTVHRQRINLSDPVTADGHARVKNVPPASSDYGVTMREAPAGLQEAVININTATDHDLVAGVSGQVIKIWKLFFRANGDLTVTIKDGATALTGAMDFAQGGSFTLPKDTDPWFTLAANSPFRLTVAQAVQLSGRVYYTQG